MINGLKKSDPIIEYPSLKKYGFEHIDDWLMECQKRNDSFAIKFYLRYVHKIINKLIHNVDDQNASIIRRGFKILEKWEG
jgi:hypothetical protein